MKHNNQVFFQGENGKAVLLIHGLTAGASMMIPLAKSLNDMGYSVHSVNLAGHGTYPQDLLHVTYEDLIAKAEYDYLCLKAEYDTVYVGGLSTGGVLGLYLAAKYPEIAGVLSLSAPMELVPTCFIAQEYPPEQVYYHRPMAGKVGLFQQYHVHYEDIAINIFAQLKALMPVVADPEVLKKVTCPTLIVQAKDDAIAKPESGPYIYDHISSTKKELYAPDKGEHVIVLTDGRHETFQRVSAFLNSL